MTTTTVDCCLFGTLLLMLVAASTADFENSASTITVCRERVVALPRTLATQRESFVVYVATLRGADKCPLQLTTPNGVYTVEMDSSKKIPLKCFACRDATSACTEEVDPPEDPLGEDCKWVLSNTCIFVKVKKSNPLEKCN